MGAPHTYNHHPRSGTDVRLKSRVLQRGFFSVLLIDYSRRVFDNVCGDILCHLGNIGIPQLSLVERLRLAGVLLDIFVFIGYTCREGQADRRAERSAVRM